MSTRRKFFKQANCAAIGSTAIASTLFNLRMTAGAATGSAPTGHKALVCLFLSGGNDSFNMLVPTDTDAYSDYTTVRTSLALTHDPDPQQSQLLPITDPNQVYSQGYGIHHHLPFLQSAYNGGNLAFVSNVGTLVQPLSLSEYEAGTKKTPVGLFSHADEQVHWQTVVPQVRGAGPKGWAGRMADCMSQANIGSSVGMNISLDGNNVLQAGASTIPYITDPKSGAVLLKEYTDSTFAAAADAILGESYKSIYQKTLVNSNRSAIDTAVAFDAAVSPTSTTELFTNERDDDTGLYNGKQTNLDKQLQMVCRILSARDPLGMNRQVFFVNRGGWDHHNEVLTSQENLFHEVNDALDSFWKELGHLGLQDDVVLFSSSDFGRTLTSNGAGSDHAWGGNAFMLGGNVNGGKIYGEYPILATGGPLDIGRGRLLPTTSVDEYVAELGSWFGVPASELTTLAPNALEFFDPDTTAYPLGILN